VITFEVEKRRPLDSIESGLKLDITRRKVKNLGNVSWGEVSTEDKLEGWRKKLRIERCNKKFETSWGKVWFQRKVTQGNITKLECKVEITGKRKLGSETKETGFEGKAWKG
jgi:hypothetical protein